MNLQSTKHIACGHTDWETAKGKGFLIESTERLSTWIEKHDYKGFEPFDGLSSYLRPLTLGNCFAERVLQQLVLRCPFHIRPLLGVKPLYSTKGMGFIARGYLRMFAFTGNSEYRDKARYCLDWLMENRSPGYSRHCWGNHFHYAARKGKIPKYLPTVVWTSLIGQSFLDAYSLLGDENYLDAAVSICRFILEDLPREETATGACLSYFPLKEQHSIHNSNMLGAAMLARTAAITGDKDAKQVAKEAIRYSCSRQLPDGAWYYGQAPTYHWIDNWHTAYNLDSLKCYIESTRDTTFEDNLRRGFDFYTKHFFESNGKPKYYHDRLHLVDIQSASQSIDTLSYFADYSSTSLSLACSVAKWTIENMQDKTGYFYYRKLRWKTVKIPMLHWGQATMLGALSHLLMRLSAVETSAGTEQNSPNRSRATVSRDRQ